MRPDEKQGSDCGKKYPEFSQAFLQMAYIEALLLSK